MIEGSNEPTPNVSNLQINSTADTQSCSSQKPDEEIHSKPSIQAREKNSSPADLTPSHYQDIPFNKGNAGYCSFSSTKTEVLKQTSTHPTTLDDEEDDQKRKIAAAKRSLFPNAIASSFSQVSDTLRNERRQEFCPIYEDETPEQVALRQSKRKPVGSLLAKRIRWDDLKRKREEDEQLQQRHAQMQYHYGSGYPPQQSFANPYEQYYATVQNQYEQMVHANRIRQEHSAFWPEHRQFQDNDQVAQNSKQYQAQPYMYPYMAVQPNYPTAPSSYSYSDYNTYLNDIRQPPPPPPDEPYPY